MNPAEEKRPIYPRYDHSKLTGSDAKRIRQQVRELGPHVHWLRLSTEWCLSIDQLQRICHDLV